MEIYERDDTGTQMQPLEGSRSLKRQDRLFHNIHKGFNAGLNGPGLAELGTRFAINLQKEVERLVAGHDDWVDIPDLYEMIRKTVFRASTEAMCGPHILALNPGFVEDFWKFDAVAGPLFKQLPKWMIPKAFEVRDRLKCSIMGWHEFAHEKYDLNDEEARDSLQWEEYFGSKLMRDRQAMFSAAGIDAESQGASDLGIIWGYVLSFSSSPKIACHHNRE